MSLALLLVAAAGCSSDPEPGATPTATGSPSVGSSGAGSGSAGTGSTRGSAAQDVVDRLLGPAAPQPAVASAEAKVQLLQPSSSKERAALTAEIIEVRANGQTTLLHWRIKSTDGGPVRPYGNWASGSGASGTDTDELVLVDASGNQRLKPYKTEPQDGLGTTSCICSQTPRDTNGIGVDLYASYPALSPKSTTVDIAIPQFPVIKGVQVTR